MLGETAKGSVCVAHGMAGEGHGRRKLFVLADVAQAPLAVEAMCFLNDGRICLTNNAAERAPRGIALALDSGQAGGQRSPTVAAPSSVFTIARVAHAIRGRTSPRHSADAYRKSCTFRWRRYSVEHRARQL
jgi:hypothetical protein